jgi:hypothetical protein
MTNHDDFHSDTILLTFGAALVIEVDIEGNLNPLFFGFILCLVNLVVLGSAIALSTRRFFKERRIRHLKKERQVLALSVPSCNCFPDKLTTA